METVKQECMSLEYARMCVAVVCVRSAMFVLNIEYYQKRGRTALSILYDCMCTCMYMSHTDLHWNRTFVRSEISGFAGGHIQ